MSKKTATTEETTAPVTVEAAPVKEKKAKPAKKVGEYEVDKQYDFPVDGVKVSHDDNSREGGKGAHSEEEIALTQKSIKQHGQLQAGLVAIEDGKPVLIAGYKRLMAIKNLNAENPDKPRLFKAMVVEAESPLERLLIDIDTNARTTELTPVDHWRAHNMLRDAGWKDAKIAKYYGVDPSYVAHLKKLDEVSEEVRARIKSGEIGLSTAKALAKLDLNEQEGALEIAKTLAEEAHAFDGKKGEAFDGKVDNSFVSAAIRKLTDKDDAPSATTEATSAESGTEAKEGEDKAPTPTPTPTKSAALNLKEVKDFFRDNYSGVAESATKKRLWAIMSDLFAGGRQKHLVSRLDALIEGKPEPEIKAEKKTKAKVEAA